ncbi:hypothetical protein [Primorskyibacter sp. S187A]|uniref:hypothetical protein n=1 Tax=Primorskyibacter sp. S187A TaxID=3415130 RepID=UPI003C7E0E49
MERLFLSGYRKLVPNRLKRALPKSLKARVREALSYFTARPGLKDLHLRHQAMAAEKQGDWAAAMGHWQHLAILSHPPRGEAGDPPAVLTPLQPDAPEDDALRKTRHALAGLRRARAHQAMALFAQGDTRKAAALVAQVVESLPDHRMLKNEPIILDAVSHYLRRALAEDGQGPETVTVSAQKPHVIVLCLDILKISDVHTHARVLFAICRNLLELDPNLTTHLVVTRERFAVTTPVVASAFDPQRRVLAAQKAAAALGPLYGTRFFLHMRESPGLEGVLETCRFMLDLKPDVVLYGGGHRGLFSNESRVVRHALFEHLPSAFFYIQSNNQVDPALDMIIARGPHAIEGDAGAARIRVQPYPTIVNDETEPPPPEITPAKRGSKIIVSAIAGLRMRARLAQQDRATLETLFALLDRVPGAVWHMIGAADPEGLARDLPVIGKRVAKGQIVVHPVLPFAEFVTRVEAAALFIHPPGFTGGSGGAAVARKAGVPILTCRDSDVSGRQPPETVFETRDMAGLTAKACEILQSDAAWAEVVSRQIAHKQWIRETAAQGFYGCLCETVEAYHARKAVE